VGGRVVSGARPPIDDRIAERRAEVRRTRRVARRRRTVTVLVLALLVGAVVALERSALVGLEEVQVAGTERLDPQTVLDAADIELGTSTLRLGLSAAEDRVVQLPLVAEAEARRIDPLTVRIEVSEREPVLNARGGGRSVQVDRAGVVILDGGRDGLPTIALPEPPPAPGERGPEDGPLAGAVAAWRGLSGPLRAEVADIEAPSGADLRLNLRSGVEVRLGRADRLDEKVRALGAVLEDVGVTDVSTIDVRAPGRPAVTP
jgi:cell division protein FtsQ